MMYNIKNAEIKVTANDEQFRKVSTSKAGHTIVMSHRERDLQIVHGSHHPQPQLEVVVVEKLSPPS